MTDTIEDLFSLYNVQMSELERARLEARIWGLVPTGSRTKGGIGGYFRWKFGIPGYATTNRHQLHLTGEDAAPLWERIDQGMPLHTAMVILRDAKRSAQVTKISLVDEIKRHIDKHDNLGVAVQTAGGKVFRRNPAGKTQVENVPSELPRATKEVSEAKNLWVAMRTMVSDYLDSRLEGCDPADVDSARRRVEADLNTVISDMQAVIRRVVNGRIDTGSVTRSQVIDACRALGMDPPSPGKAVDEKKAKLQRKLYSRQYHPDVHGGSEETRHLFQATIEAYKLLESYNEQLQSSRNGDI